MNSPDGAEAGDRGAARAHLETQRGDPAHQREPRPRHGPARGRRQRPRADRRPLRDDRDRRRRRRDPEFIASDPSAVERRHMADWPHGYQFFEHLRDLPGALRLADLPSYTRSLGHSGNLTLSKTLQATPMRHRGVHVGNFFLGEKAGGRSPARTRRSWCCSPRRRRRRSPTHARTATSREPRPTSRPWSTPRRSGWWSSMPRAAGRCRSRRRCSKSRPSTVARQSG